MNILVLGGQGFIGYNLVKRLLVEGHKVTVFDRAVRNEAKELDCKYVIGEFYNIEEFEKMFYDVDIVFHLISTTLPKTSNNNPSYDIESNVIKTVKILEMCRRAQVKKIIFPSSGGTVYGIPGKIPVNEEHPTNPICSYGISKLAIEKYLYMFKELYGLDYQILRISNPYGPYQNPFSNQGAIAVFLGKALKGEPIEVWGDGSVCRDYIYIDDLIEALILITTKNSDYKVLNIGSGRAYSVNDIIEQIAITLETNIKVNYKEARKIDVPTNVLDISRAEVGLQWGPQIDLKMGIKRTWEWLKETQLI